MLVLRVASVGLAFGIEIVLARALGREHYGHLAIGLSWLAVLSIVASLGLDLALVRSLPADLARGRLESAAGALRHTASRMLFSALVVGALFALTVGWMGESVVDVQRTVLWTVALLVPVQTLNLHRQATLRGLKMPILAFLPDQIIRPASLALFVLLLAAVMEDMGAADAVWAVAAAVLTTFVFGQFWKARRTPPRVRAARPAYDRRSLWRVALPLAWWSCMQLLFVRADPAILGILSTPEQAGLYAVALRASNPLGFGLAAVNATVAPMISELHATGRHEELQRLLRNAARWIGLYTLPLAALLLALGRPLLGLFGAGFEEAYPMLCWLVVGLSVSALAGSVGYLLAMTDHQLRAARILTFVALTKVALNFVLIPALDAQGAAVASALAMVMWNLLLYREVRRRLGLDPSCLALLRRGRRQVR